MAHTRLSPLDATFLELEEIDDGSHMHIGGVCAFEPLPGGGAPSIEEVRALLDARLGRLPGSRHRLSERRTGGLEWPAWVEDDDFSVERHVRAEALPAPGGDEELKAWTAEFYSHRLDRDHPLWEMVLLTGLEGGGWALANKTHHCMVDGVGSVDVAHVMLDLDPDAPAEPPAGEPWTDTSAGPAGWSRLPWRAAGAAAGAARAGLGAVTHPRRTLARAGRAVEWLVREEVVAAPDTSLNTPIGKHRRFAVMRARLDEVRAVKRAAGATVNDVVLAVVAGGLRAVFEERGESPPHGMRAMVPVNLRQEDERLAVGNRVSSLFVELPVDVPTAAERLRWARDHARGAKGGGQAEGAAAMLDLTSLAPPVLHHLIASSLYSRRLFNLTITNVPGPQVPLYAFGARLREVWPLVPLFAGHPLGVAIFSYDGRLVFGVAADRDRVPEADFFADAMRRELDELLSGVRDTPAPRGDPAWSGSAR